MSEESGWVKGSDLPILARVKELREQVDQQIVAVSEDLQKTLEMLNKIKEAHKAPNG